MQYRVLVYIAFLIWTGFCFAGNPHPAVEQVKTPNILILSVDTLRSDRLSAYGYERPTSPNIDRLLARGLRFERARTVEPLTAPACISMLTALYPHEHGSSRNGVPMLPDLSSLPKLLRAQGYATAAFVSNWTLRTKLTGLGEHFDHYGEVFTRKRWFGMLLSEATAEDISENAATWLNHRDREKPFLLWAHYSEPHAPYRFHRKFAGRLGIPKQEKATQSDRYDTEIAFTDHQIQLLLDRLEEEGVIDDTLIVFLSDHGESLGEHRYWGHGRNLYEPCLRIPMGLIWPGVIEPGTVYRAPAMNLDIPPTLLGLMNMPIPHHYRGFDWSAVIRGNSPPPTTRTTYHQAHRGAVQSLKAAERGRRRGLLEVGILSGGVKESLRVRSQTLRLFDLENDAAELANLAPRKSKPSKALETWALEVERGLNQASENDLHLADEDLEMLRSLGYID